jgi:hypothetical protein
MTSHISTTDHSTSLDRLKLLAWLSMASLVLSITAGALLVVLEPRSGSTTEAVLGVAAAVGGIATGVFVIAALIYAQIKNLWRLAPIGIRIVLWVFIAVGAAFTVWNLISQTFSV